MVWFCSVLLLLGTVQGELGTYAAYSTDNPWFLVQWAGYTTPCVWLFWEATLSHQGAQKRARIGLCSPIVANRYLLLALFGGLQVLACLVDLYWGYDKQASEAISMVSDALLGGSEIASVAVLWLAFFPPPFYADWITRRAVILPTPMDG